MNKFLSITAIAGALFAAAPAFAHEPHIGFHVVVPSAHFHAYGHYPHHDYPKHIRHHPRQHCHQDWHRHGAARHHGNRHWDVRRGHGWRDGQHWER